MNTSEYIPYDCVSKNIFKNKACPEFPGVGGTGFFVKFPPYKDIFYVTARHCVYDNNGLGDPSTLQVIIEHGHGKLARFDCFIEPDPDKPDELEDIIIYHVDNSSDDVTIQKLSTRALELLYQDDVNSLLGLMINKNQKLRTIGFPESDTNLSYESENPHLVLQPRGFYGTAAISDIRNHYSIINTNWKGDYAGFSGSPIIGLLQHKLITSNEKLTKKDVSVVLLGILLLGSETFTGIHFLNINFVTNAIAHYFNTLHEKAAKF